MCKREGKKEREKGEKRERPIQKQLTVHPGLRHFLLILLNHKTLPNQISKYKVKGATIILTYQKKSQI